MKSLFLASSGNTAVVTRVAAKGSKQYFQVAWQTDATKEDLRECADSLKGNGSEAHVDYLGVFTSMELATIVELVNSDGTKQ